MSDQTRVPAGVTTGGQFTAAPRNESSASLSLASTGVQVRRREDGIDFGVHEDCLAALQQLAPDAWDPFDGGWVVIGPVFGSFSCAYTSCAR